MGTKNKLTKLTIKQTRKGLKASDVDVMSERLQAWAERLYALISVVKHDLTASPVSPLCSSHPRAASTARKSATRSAKTARSPPTAQPIATCSTICG